jgi:hypothetical protein
VSDDSSAAEKSLILGKFLEHTLLCNAGG